MQHHLLQYFVHPWNDPGIQSAISLAKPCYKSSVASLVDPGQ